MDEQAATASMPINHYEVSVAESLGERRARSLKHGDTFAVLDPTGDIRSGSADGLYHLDTRHLSHLDLFICGSRPILLSSTLRDDNAGLTCDLTNPDVSATDGGVIKRDTIHIRRTRFLWNATAYERIHLRNFGDTLIEVDLHMRFEADFVDIFEVRGTKRTSRGLFRPAIVGDDSVAFAYRGLDERERRTTLRFEPRPSRIDAQHVRLDVSLTPGGSTNCFIEVAVGDKSAPHRSCGQQYLISMRDARRALRRASSRAASIDTSNEIFNEAIRRSVADLVMLNTDTPDGPYPYAGIPWFSTPFGRDAMITASEALWMDPELARGVLRYLAAHQATTVDAASDAEPGKILHEVRRGEMAETGEVPFRHYYGSVDSTPLFVMLAGAYLRRTGDLTTVRTLWPAIEAALRWIDDYGDRDHDGFVEYNRMTEQGLANQGWKDSQDSIFHADGKLADGPIALCEVQGYVYAARVAAAEIADQLGDMVAAEDLRRTAEALKIRFDEAFWCEEIGTYALALDGAKRPCRVRASNAGHSLWTGIAKPERALALSRTLMSANSFSGWGIRTVAMGEPRYNPMSYHDGSVWPHDNALIALGLARYGYKHEAARIFEALFGTSVHLDMRRLPELFCGFSRRGGQGPTFYPVACSPQAWAAAAPIALIEACLGLTFDIAGDCIEMRNPVLPRFVDRVTLRNVRLGHSLLDLVVRAADGGVTTTVIRRSGPARLVVTT